MSTLPAWSDLTNDEKIAFFREHIAANRSFSQMAALVTGATRGTLIGKHSRLKAKGVELPPVDRFRGRKGRPAKAKTENKPKRHIKAECSRSTPESKLVDVMFPVESAPSKADAFLPLPDTAPISLLDLPFRQRCRWPVDVQEQTAHFACGAPTITEFHSYCATHRHLSIHGASSQGAR